MQRAFTIWSQLMPEQQTRIRLLVIWLYVLATIVAFGFEQFWGLALVILGLALIILVHVVHVQQQRRQSITYKLTTGFRNPDKWLVYSKVYPIYKFVDIFRAAEQYAQHDPQVEEIRSEHSEMLRTLLNNNGPSHGNRMLKAPTMIARKISYDEETFLPSDTFWRLRVPSGGCIIRVRAVSGQQIQIEIASEGNQSGAMMDEILAIAAEKSIYRNHLLGVAFGPQIRSAFADEDDLSYFELIFQKELPIADSDIIFDEQIATILQRSIVDFHHRRSQLMQAGLPGKRGILFYGPPGTGKTYTCKYLFQQLKPITAVVVTGNSLTQIKTVCNVAKMFQPSLVILEDVDLVFSDRATNAYSTILGDFMDQLDGFSDTDQVLFILTTNALDRVESAIKDRPGRISQCIYFGPPTAELRRTYLEALTRPYDLSQLDFGQVIAKTNGVSQAFLKELVFRAVQVATEDQPPDHAPIRLCTDHFATALQEMTIAGGLQGKRIIGFHVEP